VRTAPFAGEEEYLGRGVSYCATCDGMLYRGRKVTVVGRADNAPEEANFLASIGCQVTYVADTRPEELADGIAFVAGKRLEVLGEQTVRALRVDGAEHPCDGVFILRRAVAPNHLLPGLEVTDGVITTDRAMATNIPGVFSAGDCTGQPWQVAKAVGEGLVAGEHAAEYLEQKNQ
jgi:thioredoxin reductase (NADPH)